MEKSDNPKEPIVDDVNDDGEDENEENDEEAIAIVNGGQYLLPSIIYNELTHNPGESKKKKKKKKPKKKKAEQSEPPRIGLSKLFPNGVYPEGEIQEYKDE